MPPGWPLCCSPRWAGACQDVFVRFMPGLIGWQINCWRGYWIGGCPARLSGRHLWPRNASEVPGHPAGGAGHLRWILHPGLDALCDLADAGFDRDNFGDRRLVADLHRPAQPVDHRRKAGHCRLGRGTSWPWPASASSPGTGWRQAIWPACWCRSWCPYLLPDRHWRCAAIAMSTWCRPFAWADLRRSWWRAFWVLRRTIGGNPGGGFAVGLREVLLLALHGPRCSWLFR